MALKAPSIKMSKTNNSNSSILYVLDNYPSIKVKIANARVDHIKHMPSNEQELGNRTGLANLLNLYASLCGVSLATVLAHTNMLDLETFKIYLRKLIYLKLRDIRRKMKLYLKTPELLDKIILNGTKCMNV